MSKKVFITVGTTAMYAVGKLIGSLRESGLYDDNEVGGDKFICIDTDTTKLEDFQHQSSSNHVYTIPINPSSPASPAVRTVFTDSNGNEKTLFNVLNETWNKVCITGAGVFGYREQSYADISWRQKLIEDLTADGDIDESTKNSVVQTACQYIIVATAYGGSASGLFFNVSEVVRETIGKGATLYAMLFMPDFSIANPKGSYTKGWLNFCNFWQQLMQAVWERRLGRSQNTKYIFPYLGGMTQSNFDGRLFPLKTEIDGFKPMASGCYTPFDRIFPLFPADDKQSRHWMQDAFVELAIFLFYQNFVGTFLGPEANLHCRDGEGANGEQRREQAADIVSGEEECFAEFNLVSARCSPESLFRQATVKQFITLWHEFMTAKYEGTPSIVEEGWDLPVPLEGDATKYCKNRRNFNSDDWETKLNDSEVEIRQAVRALPSFAEFILSYAERMRTAMEEGNLPPASLAHAVACYRALVERTARTPKGDTPESGSLKESILRVRKNRENVSDRYRKVIAKILDPQGRITESIKKTAADIVFGTTEGDQKKPGKLDEFFEACADEESFALLRGQVKKSDPATYSEDITRRIVNREAIGTSSWDATGNDLGADLTGKDFFGRTKTDGLNLAGFPGREKLLPVFIELFCKFLATVERTPEKQASSDLAENQKGTTIAAKFPQLFTQTITQGVQQVKLWFLQEVHRDDARRNPVEIQILKEQRPYYPEGVSAFDNGIFYCECPYNGGETAPIQFSIIKPALGEDIIGTWGIELYSKIANLPNAIQLIPPGIFRDIKPDDVNKQQQLRELQTGDWKLNSSHRPETKETIYRIADTDPTVSLSDEVNYKFGERGTASYLPGKIAGLWLGQMSVCMPAEKIFPGMYYLPDNRGERRLSLNRRDKIQASRGVRKRLFLTLSEDIFYGMFFGIIQQKINIEKTRKDIEEFNQYIDVTIKVDFTTSEDEKIRNLGTPVIPITRTSPDIGVDPAGKLCSIPFDVLFGLSDIFRTKGEFDAGDFANKSASLFAKAFGVEQLEMQMCMQEFDVLTKMQMHIPPDVVSKLDELSARCARFVSVTLEKR